MQIDNSSNNSFIHSRIEQPQAQEEVLQECIVLNYENMMENNNIAISSPSGTIKGLQNTIIVVGLHFEMCIRIINICISFYFLARTFQLCKSH